MPGLIQGQVQPTNFTTHSPKTAEQLTNQMPKLKEAISEFESLFIFFLIKTMRHASYAMTGKKDDSIHTFMIDQQLAWVLAKHGGIGLSSLLLDQLKEKVRHESLKP